MRLAMFGAYFSTFLFHFPWQQTLNANDYVRWNVWATCFRHDCRILGDSLSASREGGDLTIPNVNEICFENVKIFKRLIEG